MPGTAAGGYCLTRDQLMCDLYRAYLDARRHKRGKAYQMKFELHLEDNLHILCNDLWNRTYKPLPSKCFVITDPTLREVFAADFRDRVVHHLYYNYVYDLFDRTFINDCYSCRKGRGTLYGVRRMERHIREVSQNFTQPCYVLKMDISGYFMHIDRQRLLNIALQTLFNSPLKWEKQSLDEVNSLPLMEGWGGSSFLCYLTREIVLLDPTEGCRKFGRAEDWNRLPHDKSLFHSPKGQGLRVNRDKTVIYDVRHGVPFLGCFLKPGRTYIGNASWHRMKRHLLREVEHAGVLRLRSCVNSYLGLLRHVNSYKLSQNFFLSIPRLRSLGFIAFFDRKLVLSDYTLDTLMLNNVLRMIQDEDYPIEYTDVELWCHEYIDNYL